MSRPLESVRKKPSTKAIYLRLCISYSIAAFLWIVVLDWAIRIGLGELPHMEWILQGKNVLFVALSAFGLWDFAVKFLDKDGDSERELIESQERLRLVSKASHDALWLATYHNRQGKLNIVYANPGFSEIWGRSVDDISGHVNIFDKWIHDDDAHWAKPRTDLFFAGKGGSVLDAEFRLNRPDGSFRWVWTKAEIVFDTKGRPLRIAGVTRDLTDRKRTELALVESERLFKSLFDLSQDAIAHCSMDGGFISVNNAFVDFIGYDRNELKMMTFQSITYKGWKREENRILKEEVFERGYSEVYEKKCRRKDGSNVLVSVRISVVYDQQGQPSGMFAIVRDIQKEKNQLQEIVYAKEEAESANLAQNRLLAVVSHELRTPLNPIIGYSDLLLSRSNDPMQQEFLKIIRNSATVITKLIGEILDYAKIESGEIELEKTPFRISELLSQVIKEARETASEHRNSIEFSYDWKNCAVLGDKERIRQILANLVSNACKFTNEGNILLRCDLRRGSKDSAVFRFTVEDDGVGIDETQIESIFQPFQKAIELPGVGVGLGLAVARQLAVAMDGRITVKSEVGKGSSFFVDLPLPVVAFEESLPESKETSDEVMRRIQEGYRVLVVEDNKANLVFAKDLLLNFGCLVSVARNGEEALRVMAEQEFDLVLMDVSMPIMDGHEATNRLRSGDGINRNVPVVAMTADATRKSEKDCRHSGMNDFLPKPVSLNDFEGLLKKWMFR